MRDRVGEWWSESPRRPAEYASELAASRRWRDIETRFVSIVDDVDEVAPLLGLESELAHALVLVLSRLPIASRLPYARRFYRDRRARHPDSWSQIDQRQRHAMAAGASLLVLTLADSKLRTERVRDVLQGLAQTDDITDLPDGARLELLRAVAHARASVSDDPTEATTSATLAVVETLAPASEAVPLHEVVMRSTWAAVESWDPDAVFEYLLALDNVFGDARNVT